MTWWSVQSIQDKEKEVKKKDKEYVLLKMTHKSKRQGKKTVTVWRKLEWTVKKFKVIDMKSRDPKGQKKKKLPMVKGRVL